MDFLEKNLEDIIYETPNKFLRDAGLNINGLKLRQVRIGNYGIADLITVRRFDKTLVITVYELKNKAITFDAFHQAIRYIRGIQKYLEHRNFDQKVKFRIKLIGRKLDKYSDIAYIPNVFNNCIIYTYDYSFTGIRFNEEYGYQLINGF